VVSSPCAHYAEPWGSTWDAETPSLRTHYAQHVPKDAPASPPCGRRGGMRSTPPTCAHASRSRNLAVLVAVLLTYFVNLG
jgi:hypothetical protein